MKSSSSAAFTIVEMMTVVAIIGVLASLAVFGWGSWQSNVAQSAVKSDLKAAASAMESAKNFSTGYPLSIPSSYKSGSAVTVTYASGSATTYCLQGQSVKVTTVRYYVSSSQSTPVAGTCP